MRACLSNPRPSRRGITLLEMLVAVALLVLMMTIVTSIFQAATGAITVAKTFQELDGNLRQLDSVLRQDLDGATADSGNGPLTPPFNPELNLGYFEVGEGQFADRQGEDSDDYIRFTVRAPDGQPFTGRMWLGPVFLPSPPFQPNTPNQPVMIQSQYAEVIYFLRNQNLYRRVLLVAPERQQGVVINTTGIDGASTWQLPAAAFGYTSANKVYVSWQGMNDLSARPSTIAGAPPTLNTLGDLTNRENRAFYPRFCNSFVAGAGQRDDLNGGAGGDSVPDWWPTLYPNVFNTPLIDKLGPQAFARQPNTKTPGSDFPDLMSFPYVFPGAFSKADPAGGGLLHGMGAIGDTGVAIVQGNATNAPQPAPYGYVYFNGQFVQPPVIDNLQIPVYLPNHNPIPTGDTLTTPDSVATPPLQTWWGFPTWKETMSPSWSDPVLTLPSNGGVQAPGLSWANQTTGWLPPLTDPTLDLQQYNDGAGTTTFGTPATVFRDDIIMQGVRSFDVKVYDNAVPGYVDLGYSGYTGGPIVGNSPSPLLRDILLATMGHEGRIPPLKADLRPDPNYPLWLGNIGDDTASVVRLRRVWDTWSTDYSNAPATGMVPGNPAMIAGPPLTQPAYPSYPPPYPAGLRGLQIQIRVVDPRNERIKVLTVRHSFSS